MGRLASSELPRCLPVFLLLPRFLELQPCFCDFSVHCCVSCGMLISVSLNWWRAKGFRNHLFLNVLLHCPIHSSSFHDRRHTAARACAGHAEQSSLTSTPLCPHQEMTEHQRYVPNFSHSECDADNETCHDRLCGANAHGLSAAVTEKKKHNLIWHKPLTRSWKTKQHSLYTVFSVQDRGGGFFFRLIDVFLVGCGFRPLRKFLNAFGPCKITFLVHHHSKSCLRHRCRCVALTKTVVSKVGRNWWTR